MGKTRDDMVFRGVGVNQLADRKTLLAKFDDMRREADATGLMEGLDAYEKQAFNLVLGTAPAAFDLAKEDKATIDNYGKDLGQQLRRRFSDAAETQRLRDGRFDD